ncbi:MAG: hypothetical protein HRU40_21560 [Saprospiraceae bacterium]|nr:hypothetical protein [Saprospiraceae bacterium]
MNKISKFFEEGDQQQHSGENWFIYGKGSKNGWSIKAPKPDPDGANKSIDISDMFPNGGGVNGLGKGILNPVRGIAGFNEKVNSAVDRLQKPDSIICDFCSGKRFPLKDKKFHSNVRDTTTNGNPVPNN